LNYLTGLKTALFDTAAPNFLGDGAAIPSKIRRSNAKNHPFLSPAGNFKTESY
jgi:hypothetical protein